MQRFCGRKEHGEEELRKVATDEKAREGPGASGNNEPREAPNEVKDNRVGLKHWPGEAVGPSLRCFQ